MGFGWRVRVRLSLHGVHVERAAVVEAVPVLHASPWKETLGEEGHRIKHLDCGDREVQGDHRRINDARVDLDACHEPEQRLRFRGRDFSLEIEGRVPPATVGEAVGRIAFQLSRDRINTPGEICDALDLDVEELAPDGAVYLVPSHAVQKVEEEPGKKLAEDGLIHGVFRAKVRVSSWAKAANVDEEM